MQHIGVRAVLCVCAVWLCSTRLFSLGTNPGNWTLKPARVAPGVHSASMYVPALCRPATRSCIRHALLSVPAPPCAWGRQGLGACAFGNDVERVSHTVFRQEGLERKPGLPPPRGENRVEPPAALPLERVATTRCRAVTLLHASAICLRGRGSHRRQPCWQGWASRRRCHPPLWCGDTPGGSCRRNHRRQGSARVGSRGRFRKDGIAHRRAVCLRRESAAQPSWLSGRRPMPRKIHAPPRR